MSIRVSFLSTSTVIFCPNKTQTLLLLCAKFSNFIYFAGNSFYISIKVLIMVRRKGGVWEITRNLVYFQLYRPFFLFTKSYPIIQVENISENSRIAIYMRCIFVWYWEKCTYTTKFTQAENSLQSSSMANHYLYSPIEEKGRKAVKTKWI